MQQNANNNEELDFSYYINVIFKRFWIIISFIFIGALAAILVNNFMRPAYQANVLIMINQENSGKIDTTNAYGSFTAEEDYYRTQYKLLESRSLVQKVYNTLGLDTYEEFANPYGWKKLQKAISISPVTRSRLVSLGVTSYDPDLSVEIANTLASTFVADNISNRIFMGRDVIKALESPQTSAEELELLNSMPQVVNSDFIKNLKLQESQLQNKQAELMSKYTRQHPDYISVKRQLESVQNKIAVETRRLVQSIKIELSGQFSGNNIRIVDAATKPEKPIRPRNLLNLAIGLTAGAILGFLCVFLLEFLDQTIKTSESVEAKLKQPFLGFVPQEKLKKNEPEYTFMIKQGYNLLAENIRNIRTMLGFSLSQTPNAPVLITSSLQGEGKTNLSVNLSAALAQAGKKVLLIDGDLRRARLHKAFHITPDLGLSNIWSTDDTKADYNANIQAIKDVPGLYVMTAGNRPPNPAELLNTPKLLDLIKWAENNFDQVLIDCPAILPVSDTLLWGKYIPRAVFVVSYGKTNTHVANSAVDKLNKANIKILGAVIGHYEPGGMAYGKYGYYKKSYNYYTNTK